LTQDDIKYSILMIVVAKSVVGGKLQIDINKNETRSKIIN